MAWCRQIGLISIRLQWRLTQQALIRGLYKLNFIEEEVREIARWPEAWNRTLHKMALVEEGWANFWYIGLAHATWPHDGMLAFNCHRIMSVEKEKSEIGTR